MVSTLALGLLLIAGPASAQGPALPPPTLKPAPNAETAPALIAARSGEGRGSRRTAPEVALSTKVPDYVLRQLRRRYAESGMTIRNQILFALRLAGIDVHNEDLHDERKSRK